MTQTKRRMMREAREEFRQLQEKFGDTSGRSYEANDCGTCRGRSRTPLATGRQVVPMAKHKKKPARGAGFSVTLPTEPMAGEAKNKPIMAVLVQDEGNPLFLSTKSRRGSQSASVSAAPSRRIWSASARPRTLICSWTPTAATPNPLPSNTSTRLPVRKSQSVAGGAAPHDKPRGESSLDDDRAQLGVKAWLNIGSALTNACRGRSFGG